MIRRISAAITILLVSIVYGYSQEVSEKAEISVFGLSYYSYRVPDDVLANIDSSIRSVFVDMGRFRVIEVAKTFENQKDLASFIDQIRKIREKKVEIPEEVSFGRMVFSEADLEDLISSFIVIVPELLSYSVKEKRNKKGDREGFEAEFKTTYTILDASTMEVVGKPVIEASGDADDRTGALESAIDSMSASLTFELKKVPIFTLKTGVLEVEGGKITLKRGKNMGILPGFEFELVRTSVLKSGDKKDVSDGLVLVSSVYEEVSDAVVLYGEPQEGDQLKEVPRAGGELSLYAQVVYNLEDAAIVPIVGFSATVTLGMFSVRPVLAIEVPFADLYGLGGAVIAAGIPCMMYIGVQIPVYMGRLQITPTIMVGAGGIYLWEAWEDDEDQRFAFTHIGGKVFVGITYLVDRDMKVSLDAGAIGMWSPLSTFFDSITPLVGPFGGLSVIFKI